MSSKRLPPPPPPPRIHTPARTSVSGTLPKPQPTSETPTASKGLAVSIYQGLLSVFDEMTTEERLEFVELAFVFSELGPEDRKALVELANRLKG